MFDLGFGMGEILLIAILALVFVGPQDLPKLMFEIGKKVNYLRGIADDFKRGMNEIVYQEEAEKLKAEILQQKADLENAVSLQTTEKEKALPAAAIVENPEPPIEIPSPQPKFSAPAPK